MFAALRASGPLPLAVPERFEDYIADRQAQSEEAATAVVELARAGRLPDVRLDETGRTITPLRAVTPPAVKAARQAPYARVPESRITDVLMNVDAWTGFSGCSRTGAPGARATTRRRCSPACSPTASTSG